MNCRLCLRPVEITYAGIPVCWDHFEAHNRGELNLVQAGEDEGLVRRTMTGWERVR